MEVLRKCNVSCATMPRWNVMPRKWCGSGQTTVELLPRCLRSLPCACPTIQELTFPPPNPHTYVTCIFHLVSNIDFNSRGYERVTEGKDRLAEEVDTSREVDACKCSSRLHISRKHLLSSFRSICEVPFLSVCLALQGFFVSLSKSI